MFDRLEGKRIVLRKARKKDLERIWKNVWSDGTIASNMLWQVTPDLEAARERLEKTISYQSNNPAYFVVLKETDEPIGFGGVHTEGEGVYSESGLCIAPKWQHMGYGREMMLLLMDLVFEKLNADRFIYSCFSTNTASRALCTSLGFTYLSSSPGIREHDGFRYVSGSYFMDRDTYRNKREGE